jgi:hypothetical protein
MVVTAVARFSGAVRREEVARGVGRLWKVGLTLASAVASERRAGNTASSSVAASSDARSFCSAPECAASPARAYRCAGVG